MQILRWLSAVTLMVTGGSLIATASAGQRLQKYRDPVPTAIADLEQGKPPPSVHATLDAHWEIRGLIGYSAKSGEPERADKVCLLAVSNGNPFMRALSANQEGGPAEAMRVAPIPRPVLVVTDRYENESPHEITAQRDEQVGPVTGYFETPGNGATCQQLLEGLGVSKEDCLILAEGEAWLPPLPFTFFSTAGFLFLLASPVPILWARRRDREALAAPVASLPKTSGHPPEVGVGGASLPPTLSSAPPSSNYPPASSLPPAGLDLTLGANVIVRRGAQQLAATVVAVEAGRCRCEFADGKQAWVRFTDIRNG